MAFEAFERLSKMPPWQKLQIALGVFQCQRTYLDESQQNSTLLCQIDIQECRYTVVST